MSSGNCFCVATEEYYGGDIVVFQNKADAQQYIDSSPMNPSLDRSIYPSKTSLKTGEIGYLVYDERWYGYPEVFKTEAEATIHLQQRERDLNVDTIIRQIICQ